MEREIALGSSGRARSAALFVVLLLLLALAAGAILLGASRLQTAPEPSSLGHLAYVTWDGLYVADWDARNARRVLPRDQLPGPEDCREFWGGPSWSPDGRHLAFRPRRDDRCGPAMVITDAEGSTVATIPATGASIAWSPDSRIATWVLYKETVGIYRADGTRQALIPAPPGTAGGDRDVSWTPDGAAILVPHAIVLPLDGTASREISSTDYPLGSKLSPDGATFAYPLGIQLVVAGAAGSRPVLASFRMPSTFRVLDWSPDGRRIALALGRRSGPEILDVATGRRTSIRVPNEDVEFVRFSPEGERILLQSFEAADGTSSLWSTKADGYGARMLVAATVGGDWQRQGP